MPIELKGWCLKYSKTGLLKKKKDTTTTTLQYNCLEKNSGLSEYRISRELMCIVKSLEELRPSEGCTARSYAGNQCVGVGVFPAHPFANLSRWEEVPRQPGQTCRTDHCCLQSSVHVLGRIKKNNSPFQESKELFRNFLLIVRKIGCLEATHPSCQNLGWKKDQDSLGI